MCTKAVVYDFHNVALTTFIRPKVLYNTDKMNIWERRWNVGGSSMGARGGHLYGSVRVNGRNHLTLSIIS